MNWPVSPSYAIDLQDARERQKRVLRETYMVAVLEGLAKNPAVIKSLNPTGEELASMKKLANQIVDVMLSK